MKKVTFEEYQEAKEKTLYGKKYKVYTDLINNVIKKTYACRDGSAFYERTENGKTEFWSTDHSESRIYVEGQRNLSKEFTLEEQREILTGALNGTLKLYQETGEESLKHTAIGYVILAEALGIIDQDTMTDIIATMRLW